MNDKSEPSDKTVAIKEIHNLAKKGFVTERFTIYNKAFKIL